jgi:hypothetical protein
MREKTYDAIGYVVTALFLGALALIIFLTEVYQIFLHWVKPASGR